MQNWKAFVLVGVALLAGAAGGGFFGFRHGEKTGKLLGEENGKILGSAACSNAHRALGHTTEGREKLFRVGLKSGEMLALVAATVATGGRLDRSRFDRALEDERSRLINRLAEIEFANPNDYSMVRGVLNE